MIKPAARYYDLLSENYDRVTAEPGVWTPPGLMAQFLKPLLEDRAKLLDIGIGTGQLIAQLKASGKNLEVHGVEQSQKMGAHCLDKYPEILLFHGDILEVELPYADYYDIITLCGTLEFIPDLNALLSKCAELLKCSGQLVFTYEPVIIGHPVQSQEKSLTLPSTADSKLQVEDFFTYRYTAKNMHWALHKSGFECQADVEFVAYRKQDSAIIYHLISAKKNQN